MATKKEIEDLENAMATQDALTRQGLRDAGIEPDAKEEHKAVGVFDCKTAQEAEQARAELGKIGGVKAWGQDTQVLTGPEHMRNEIDSLAKKRGWSIQWIQARSKG